MFKFLTALAVGGILVFFILFQPKGLVFSLALMIIFIQRRFFKLDSGCNGLYSNAEERWRPWTQKYRAAHDDICCINKETHVKVHSLLLS